MKSRHDQCWITVVFCALASCFIGCSGSQNSVDAFLTQFEGTIKSWESKASSGKLSLDDMNELNKLTIDLSAKAEKLKTADKWSTEQLKRYSDLTTRFSKVMLDLSKNPPKFPSGS